MNIIKSKNRIFSLLCWFSSALFAVCFLGGCFTGIEGTSKITLPSDIDRPQSLSAEQTFFASVSPDSLGSWRSGKPFYVLDDKLSSLLFPLDVVSVGPEVHAGDTLHYEGLDWRRMPDNSDEAMIIFRNSNGVRFALPSGRGSRAELSSLTALNLDMFLDLGFLGKVDSLLRGKTLWSLSSLWYDDSGARIEGRKFYPLKVVEVSPGNAVLPLAVRAEADGRIVSIHMNQSDRGADARSFPKIFSLSDPREKYPSVSQANWELIQRGKVAKGMNKLECRLALGNPQDVDKGHDYNSIYEIWIYSDGKSLWFQDGLLDKFRE